MLSLRSLTSGMLLACAVLAGGRPSMAEPTRAPALPFVQTCDPSIPTAPPSACGSGVTCSEYCYGPRGCADEGGQCLNLFQPSTIATNATVLWIHGGGWSTAYAISNKDNPFHVELGLRLAALGAPVVSCNYYLSGYDSCQDITVGPPADHAEAIKDIKRVMDWIRGPVGTGLGLPPRIVVAGTSAGGHLAAMAAMTQGSNEGFYDPISGHDYSTHLAILYSPPLDFVQMGCEGIPLTTNCLDCFDPADCTPCASNLIRTSPVPPGYPCKDVPNGVCYDSALQEWFLGQKWNPASPPLTFALPGNPPRVKKYNCSNYPQTPAMPTGNRWFDASPLYWVGPGEPTTYIIAAACDKWVSVAESQNFALRMAANGNVCNLTTIAQTGPCSVGCKHSAEFFAPSGTVIADEMWTILAANP